MSVTSSWHFPPFHLDCASSSLWREGQLVALPPKPFAVLAHLVSHAGEVVTKEDLLDSVWPDTAVTEGVLKGCIRQLRQVLGETAAEPRYIVTVHRRGYRFVAPATAEALPDVVPEHASLSYLPASVPVQAWWTEARGASLMVGREVELAEPAPGLAASLPGRTASRVCHGRSRHWQNHPGGHLHRPAPGPGSVLAGPWAVY